MTIGIQRQNTGEKKQGTHLRRDTWSLFSSGWLFFGANRLVSPCCCREDAGAGKKHKEEQRPTREEQEGGDSKKQCCLVLPVERPAAQRTQRPSTSLAPITLFSSSLSLSTLLSCLLSLECIQGQETSLQTKTNPTEQAERQDSARLFSRSRKETQQGQHLLDEMKHKKPPLLLL